MIKKLLSVFISVMLAFQACSVLAQGEYYQYRALEKVGTDILEYQGSNISLLEQVVNDTKKSVHYKEHRNKIAELANKCISLYEDIFNSYTVATVNYDIKADEHNSQKLNEASEAAVGAATLLNEFIYTIYNSEYSYIIPEVLGEVGASIYMGLPDDAEVNELLDKEQRLANKYNEVYGDSEKCAELFLELVDVRNALAQKVGYSDYAEYANEVVYGRGFTDEEIERFYNGVQGFLIPIYFEALSALEVIESTPLPMSEDDILLKTRSVMEKMSGELLESFDYMIANNLYDISYSDLKSKSRGGYTVLLPKQKVPFLYINPEKSFEEDGVDTIHTLVHEFGHFSAMLNSPELNGRYGGVLLNQCIETSEVQSQGLELLTEHYYGKLFGAGAAYERYYLLCNILGAILDGCLFNEWQTQVYSMESPTVENLNDAAGKLLEKYYGVESDGLDVETYWTAIPHNFSMPMYYVSYALSGVTALGIYSESINDYSGAVDKYMQASASGAYTDFEQLTKDCGLYNIYEYETMRKIAADIKSIYAIGYPDVLQDAWYMPYIYSVSNLMYGRAENTFMPDSPITRSEFVGAIGRMYDYYVGIDKEYANTFADTGMGDENVKYIAWANANGIVTGYDDNTFGGNDLLTREQAAAIIFRLSGETSADAGLSEGFADYLLISDWAKEPIGWAVQAEIINGRDNNEFAPHQDITRAETAKIIACYIKNQY